MLRLGPAGTFAAFGVLAATACVAACVNPKTDYDDFLARTADAGGVEDSAVAFEGSAPPAAFSQQYAMACVSQAAYDNSAEATLFAVSLKYTPSAGGGGTVNFTDTPLPVGATSLSQAITAYAAPSTCTVSPGGVCNLPFTGTQVPPQANAVDGELIQFTQINLELLFGEDPQTHLCASLSGTATEPLDITFDPSLNPCVLTGTTGGVPVFVQSQFHCP
jgi:hypothetical protein